MVEFAIVISVFMVLVMGGFEFGRMIFEWGRTVEATRIGVRTAVVSTPPEDCLDRNDRLDIICWDANGQPLEDSTGCDLDIDSPILLAMQRIKPTIKAANVKITYACSGAGFPGRPTPVPVITVEVQNLTFEPVVAGLLGLPTQITVPAFASSQTGESMRDLN